MSVASLGVAVSFSPSGASATVTPVYKNRRCFFTASFALCRDTSQPRHKNARSSWQIVYTGFTCGG
eukprot:30918-Pelagococcus_subviridis.AAC.21